MFDYYTGIIAMTWMILAVLSVLIRENNRIASEDKKAFYLTYVLIASAALAEMVGVYLNGRAGYPKEFLLMAKYADYTLTPMAGVALVEKMYRENRKEKKILWGFFIGNMIFQVISFSFGWTLTVDEYNCYSHGPFYFVYVFFYLSVVAMVIYHFIFYGNQFRRKNRLSLYAIMIFILVGIFLQETSVTHIRTAYLSMAVGACLLFIHYTEFAQLKSDDSMTVQQLRLMTDPLTMVKSRYAYSEMLKSYRTGDLPRDLVAFSVDINGLKNVNDTLGHEAGDELICAAARYIEHVIVGDCFRTGGDEFVVLSKMDKSRAEEVLRELDAATAEWTGRLVGTLSLAAGYAAAVDHPGCSAEALIRQSDLLMYAAKSEYYQQKGNDRRK